MSLIFDYQSPIVTNSLMPGSHKSQQRGPGSDFFRKTYFLDEPVPSRIDLNASLTDPFEYLHVKSFRQTNRLNVMLLIDGSSSMMFERKPKQLQQLYESIALSVTTIGDAFKAYWLTDNVHLVDDLPMLQDRLAEAIPEQYDACDIKQLVKVISHQPTLIFLASDFYWPNATLQTAFNLLSSALVVPVVLWQKNEFEDYPLWRFVEHTDLETGKSILVFVTPHQKQLIEKSYQQRSQSIEKTCRNYGFKPFWLMDDYHPRAMTQYFAQLV